MKIAYTLLVGLPLCVMFCALGTFLCLTIIGFPAGAAMFMLAFKVLTIKPNPRPASYTVKLRDDI